jgi:UDP-N-acetylmuramoyl-tripeptide--D-alanyl-D-alanine ligase
MRSEVLQIGGITVVDDCYNANPASMENALKVLAALGGGAGGRRLVFVCGDMAELGPEAAELHAELGVSIARAGVGLLLAVGELSRAAAEAARRAGGRRLAVECFTDAVSACNNLEKFIKDYDIVLVKGSRCMGLESVVGRLREIFGR